MKTIRFLAVLAICATALAQPAGAIQVTLTGGHGYGPYQAGQGGEFTLRPSADLSYVLGYYGQDAKDVKGLTGTFQTFCIEEHEYIWPSTTYDAVVSDHTEFTGKTLTKGAAWLYSEFALGTLAGYDYANRTTASTLQDTFWWLMGDRAQPSNPFASAVLSQFNDAAGALAPNSGFYNVGVLNLWAPGEIEKQGWSRQDQLVLLGPPNTPHTAQVPETGATLTFLCLGLGSLVFLKRVAPRLA